MARAVLSTVVISASASSKFGSVTASGDAAVPLHEIEPIDRHEQPIPAGKLEHHEVAVEASPFRPAEAGIAGDAMIDMDDQGAHGQILKIGDEGGMLAALPDRRLPRLAEQVPLGMDCQTDVRQLEAAAEAADREKPVEVPALAGLSLDEGSLSIVEPDSGEGALAVPGPEPEPEPETPLNGDAAPLTALIAADEDFPIERGDQ